MRNIYGILNGAKCFVDNGSQNCLVFQPVFQYFQTFTGANKIFTWKSGRLSEDIFKVPVTSDNSFVLKLPFIFNRRIEVKFKGNCLIQDKTSFTHSSVVNLFFVYKLDTWSRYLNTDFI